MNTTVKVFADGTKCSTGPTCHRHVNYWNPQAKLQKALETGSFEKPKNKDVNEFFGDAAPKVADKPETSVKKPRLSKEEWKQQKEEKLKGFHDELVTQIDGLKNDNNWHNVFSSVFIHFICRTKSIS